MLKLLCDAAHLGCGAELGLSDKPRSGGKGKDAQVRVRYLRLLARWITDGDKDAQDRCASW